MTTVAIPLSDDRLAALRGLAEVEGLSVEQFLSRWIEELLDRRDEEFKKVTDYVFRKNAELYRRLA